MGSLHRAVAPQSVRRLACPEFVEGGNQWAHSKPVIAAKALISLPKSEGLDRLNPVVNPSPRAMRLTMVGMLKAARPRLPLWSCASPLHGSLVLSHHTSDVKSVLGHPFTYAVLLGDVFCA